MRVRVPATQGTTTSKTAHSAPSKPWRNGSGSSYLLRIPVPTLTPEGLTYYQASGIGQWLFIATQILCLIAMSPVSPAKPESASGAAKQ